MFNWLSNSHITTAIGIWLAALGTLAIYSILYKENRAYRLAEHIFIGATSGYLIYTTWAQILKPLWWDKLSTGESYWVYALVVGAMFYFIFVPKHVWISRLVFGSFMGLVAGMQFKLFAGYNMDQIHASFKPVVVHGTTTAQSVGMSLNNVLFILILLTVMSYFFFSFEHKNAIRTAPAKVGRWVLMFAFGAMFGATVMARMSLLIGRMYFLLHDWLHLAR